MTASVDRWADVYRDVHANPELGFAETRTAGLVEGQLESMGFEVTTQVGRTGVVGLFRNGPGPTVLVRADMDALPVLEATGLPYASTQVITDAAGNPTGSFPAVINDEAACVRTRPALQSVSPVIVDPGPVTGSEDVGLLARAAGAPCVYWLLGGANPASFDGATTIEELAARARDLPPNHSPMFAPVIEPTLSTGIGALTAAARTWLQQ